MSPFAYTFRPWRMRDGEIVVASEQYWKKPLAWNRDASFLVDLGNDRPRVLVDVDLWSTQSTVELNARLFCLIDDTPNLIWVIRTEHPEWVRAMWPTRLDSPCRDGSGMVSHDFVGDKCRRCDVSRRPNVWLAATVTSQAEADERIPELLKLRELCGRLAVHVAPVEEVRIAAKWFGPQSEGQWLNVVECGHKASQYGINWVTIRGEIGRDARATNIAHVRSLVCQCKDAGVPVWVERLGSRVRDNDERSRCHWPALTEFRFYTDGTVALVRDRNGADPTEWPEDLRVREVPT